MAVATFVCVVLTACADAPPVRPANSVLPGAFTASQPTLPEADLDRWWLLYDDLQLVELEERALNGSFSVREAFARLGEAGAIRSGALARYGVRGDLSGNAQVQRTEQLDGGLGDIGIPVLDLGDFGGGSVTRYSAGLSLPVSWEFDLFNRRGAARKVADADLAAARFAYEASRAALAGEVARSLFQLRGLAAQLNDAGATLSAARRLMDVLATRSRRGITARSEVDRVAADVAQAQAQVEGLKGALDASRRALLALVGSGTAPVDSIAVDARVADPPQVPAALPGTLLERRPDIREAEARMLAATGQVRLAELDFLPRLTLQPLIGLNYSDSRLGGLNALAAAGAGLTAPIFDRARLRSQLGASSARAEQAVLAYERTVQTAYAEADQALIQLVADRARIAALETGASAAERAHDAALRRFDLGFADLQEVLDAEQAARRVRSALTAARVQGLQRSVTAFQALGGGWSTAEQRDD